MQPIEIIKGDFGKGKGFVKDSSLFVPSKKNKGQNEEIKFKEIKKVEIEKMQTKPNLGKSAALAGVGGIALGPLGLVGGALLGGSKVIVTLQIETKKGKKITARADLKTAQKVKDRVS